MDNAGMTETSESERTNQLGEALVELRGIRKEFPGVVALDHVNMKIRKGHIHALVGENGAGKSTLMKILSGTYQNYEGQIFVNGKEVRLKNEKDAFEHGISIVAQELNYVAEQTIAENLFLGRAPLKKRIFIDEEERNRRTEALLKIMNLPFRPAMKMKELSVAQKQMIEILKAISRNAQVIIMDEPTSALTSKETMVFFQTVRKLRDQGIAFVFISHRLEEVFELCDDYTVLRDGKEISTGNLKDVTADNLISMMVGREIQDIYPPLPQPSEDVMLDIRGLTSEPVFRDVSFQIHKGEIFGLAGMMGAGRSEIARAIFGMDPHQSGTICLDGEELHFKNNADAIRQGIAMVLEDRGIYGFAGVRSVRENIKIPNRDIYSRHGFWLKNVIDPSVDRICSELKVKAPSPDTLVGTLSGGNQQKVVLAKWLVRNVKLLILDEPTRGIDVGSKQEIYTLITSLAERGIAILLISSDMPEVLSMSHRIGVVAHGHIANIFAHQEATQDLIMKTIIEAK